MFNPIQVVQDSAQTFWATYWRQMHGHLSDWEFRQRASLQIEACHCAPDDPHLIDMLPIVGAVARAVFQHDALLVYLGQNPLTRPLVVRTLECSVINFEEVGRRVAAAIHITRDQWGREDYWYDLGLAIESCPRLIERLGSTSSSVTSLPIPRGLPRRVATAHAKRCGPMPQAQQMG